MLTAHRLIYLRRQFPDLEYEKRSISELTFTLDCAYVQVWRPPAFRWIVEWPIDQNTGWMVPKWQEPEIYRLRDILVDWFEPPK